MKTIENYKSLAKNLKELAAHVNDSVMGFEKAAEKARNSSKPAARQFLAMKETRQRHAKDLNDRLACIGKDEVTGGSTKGAAHTALITVKDLFTDSDSPETLYEESLRGEKKLLNYIDETFDEIEVIDDTTRMVIVELKGNVISNLSELEAY